MDAPRQADSRRDKAWQSGTGLGCNQNMAKLLPSSYVKLWSVWGRNTATSTKGTINTSKYNEIRVSTPILESFSCSSWDTNLGQILKKGKFIILENFRPLLKPLPLSQGQSSVALPFELRPRRYFTFGSACLFYHFSFGSIPVRLLPGSIMLYLLLLYCKWKPIAGSVLMLLRRNQIAGVLSLPFKDSRKRWYLFSIGFNLSAFPASFKAW